MLLDLSLATLQLVLPLLGVSAAPLVTPAETNFALKVVAAGSPYDGWYLEASHVGAGEDIAVVAPSQGDVSRFCHFYLDGTNLVELGGTPAVPYAATLIAAYGLYNVVQITPGESPAAQWTVNPGGFLMYDNQLAFYACPDEVTPDRIPTEPVVGLGQHVGCENIRLQLEYGCTAPAPALAKRQASTTVYPTYLVPVKPSDPDKSFGSVFSPDVTYDLPLEVGFFVPNAGATCELWFWLPGTGANPGNGVSSYTVSEPAQFTVQQTTGVLNTATTWNNRPTGFGDAYPFHLVEGQLTHITTVGCAQNQQQNFELTASNGSRIAWFEVNKPPAVGMVLVQY